MITENIIINDYLKKLSKNNKYSLSLNDDIFFDDLNQLAISSDCYNEGIHFLNFLKPDLVFKKVIRASISDLVCKGVKPKYYFINFTCRKKILNSKILSKIVKSINDEQKKYNIKISGGDTTLGKNISISVFAIGYSKKIIKRNNAKVYDDIYLTGNIGDSYAGLKILKGQIRNKSKNLINYFKNKYYLHDIPHKIINLLKLYANTSIDISDGLIVDINKLINTQNLSYELYLDKIPISTNLKKLIKLNNLKKENLIFNGDDYQTVFTAPKIYRRKIYKSACKINQKISIIGRIIRKKSFNSLLIGQNAINTRNFRGYYHKF